MVTTWDDAGQEPGELVLLERKSMRPHKPSSLNVSASAQACGHKHTLVRQRCPLCCAEVHLPPVLRAAVKHYEPPEVHSITLSALVEEDQHRTFDAIHQNVLAEQETLHITKPIKLLGNVLNWFVTRLSLY